MLSFLLGFLIPFAALTAAAVGLHERVEGWAWPPVPVWKLILILLVLPVSVATLTTDLAARLRRPRLFDLRARRPLAAVVRGAVTAGIACGVVLVALTYLHGVVDDAVITGATAAGLTAVSVLTLPRVRRGRCVHCDYDLGTGVGSGGSTGPRPRCPECGALHSAGGRVDS